MIPLNCLHYLFSGENFSYFQFSTVFTTVALSGSVEDLSVLTLDRHQTGVTEIAVLLRNESGSVVMVLSVPNSLVDGGGLQPHMHVYACTHAHTHAYTCKCTCTHTHTHTHTHTCTCTHDLLSIRFLLLALFLFWMGADPEDSDMYLDSTRQFGSAVCKREIRLSEPASSLALLSKDSAFITLKSSKFLCRIAFPSAKEQVHY